MAAGYAKADRGSGKGEKTSGEGGGGEWVAQPVRRVHWGLPLATHAQVGW